jgi:adenylate kinase
MDQALVVVFLGPPGSGKGTQAKELSQQIAGMQHVSTGDLFRNEIARQSDVGIQVDETIKAGKLVNDELTYKVLKNQLVNIIEDMGPRCLIFDGYPRNGNQVVDLAKLLKEVPGLKGPVFFELELPKDVIVERISGRLVNPRLGIVYHKTGRPPKVPGKCDQDGGELIQRADDKPEVVGGRFDIYQKGLVEMLVEIKKGGYPHFKFNGNAPVEQISESLKNRLMELCEGLTER